MRVTFDHGPMGGAALFENARQVIEAWTAEQVPAALSALDAAEGWLAGYCSYELGYALEPRLHALMPSQRRVPLIRFGVYDAPKAPTPVAPSGGLGPLVPQWSAADHAAAIAQVRGYIAAGDVYQINLTFPVEAEAHGTPQGLFAALAAHQSVGHGALIEQDGPAILSRSPELFYRVTGGQIETLPMKGTMPRGLTPAEDAAHRDFLASDEKNRAENLMIVDLLRNDLSRVCVPGTVRVPDLFRVDTYATVHQMVSRVTARLRPEVTTADILAALFPCGSITGAPKLRAMQIIRDLEPWPRDIYCGSIGWIAPNGDACMNVAIRTLLIEDRRATLNVGGGIVWDSTAEAEYAEALWKTRFAQLPLVAA